MVSSTISTSGKVAAIAGTKNKQKQPTKQDSSLFSTRISVSTSATSASIYLILVITTVAVIAVLLGIVLSLYSTDGRTAESKSAGIFSFVPSNNEDNALDIAIRDSLQIIRVVGKLGLSLPESVGQWTACSPDQSCIEWGDYARVELKAGSAPECGRVEWTSSYANELEDCYEMETGIHWYGGGETHTQTWPIENNPRQLSPFVTGDFLQSHEYYYGGVVENYWLLSNGVSIVVDPTTPLHFSLNTTRPDRVCFVAKNKTPFEVKDVLKMGYEWCVGSNLKEAHQVAMKTFFEKPASIPDEVMLIRPFWSTWAEYKVDVNQSIVLNLAKRVVSEGFGNSSHIEIDDNWETCYGEEKFNPEKFPDPKAMIDEIKGMNMKVTAWVHPFINYECTELFNEGMRNGYFVKDSKPRVGISWWWQGKDAGVIDMTNPEATAWWTARLRKLQEDTGLAAYKFDAGEANWLPAAANLNNDTDHALWPQLYTTSYVETCAEFGGLIETRVGHLNQKQPIFIRMLDKDSRWGYDNGLKSLIPTLLHMGIVGYPFVLPDMIGGNAYNGENPSKELYVRWMQSNIFMPAVQFSLVPWNYDAETVEICLDVLAKREQYRDEILAAARQSTVDGTPINRPIWWVEPENFATHAVDDEYMLGDKILVAPVVEEGATSRDIYLPQGTWVDQDGTTHQGRTWLRNYPAPLNVVPFFIKQD